MKQLSKMNAQRNWIICCLVNFIVASIIGLLMRFAYLFPLKNINYIYLLHAHSHVAMLGWAYLMIYTLIVHVFIPKDKADKPIYNQLFWITEFTVVGMMISFPLQGYALFSIVFSTLHILLSYVFCWLVWKDCSKDKSAAGKLLMSSILFMLFSTFGIWCLGPTINMLGKQSVFYQIAIQFFLHFQFNGWFLFAILALFIKQFKNEIEAKQFRIFLKLLVLTTLFTVTFPISWFIENQILKWINTLGVLLQLISFLYFYKMLQPQTSQFKANINSITKLTYVFALSALFLKITLQFVVLAPNLTEVSHQIRNWVIGFIHLTTLGIITGFLFGILLQNNLLPRKAYLLKIGVKCFFFGYVITEILLFLQGIFYFLDKGLLFGYYEAIFGGSIFIVAGLLLILISVLKTKTRFD
jgi:hypothetical protein